MKVLNRFSRITTPGRAYIPQIDGLRFVAILAVLAFHVQAICLYHLGVTSQKGAVPTDGIYKLFEAGHFGVQLFFTISGFVLAIPFVTEKLCGGSRVNWPAYYLRRVTRLEPPYIIHLILVFILIGFVLRKQPAHSDLYQNPAWAIHALKHLLPSLFYSHGFVYAEYPYPNIVLWSLEVEVQFYVLAPFLSYVFLVPKKQWRRGLLVMLIIAASVLSQVLGDQILHHVMLLGELQFFLGGFLFADIYLTDKLAVPARSTIWSMIWDALFLLAVAGVALIHNFPQPALLLPWLMFVVCLAAFKGRICSIVFGNPLITAIGGMCYTIYMYHWLMISGVIRLTKGLQTHLIWWDLMVQLVLISLIILPICALLFVLFERPFMRKDWPGKLWAALTRHNA